MLLFQQKFLEAIRSGRKTQTIRIWPHRKYRAGQRSYIPGIGYIEITSVDPIALGELTDHDAQLDGFASRHELLAEIERIYPHGLQGDQSAWRLRFRVFTPAEQEQARQERAAKKRGEPLPEQPE
jgi:hypothetical protein